MSRGISKVVEGLRRGSHPGLFVAVSSCQSAHLTAAMNKPFFEAEEPASVACTYLIAKAAYKWREVEGDYRDDISAIVVYLPLFDD